MSIRTTLKTILTSYQFNLDYVHQLVEDIPEGDMAKMPGKGLENSPAWTIGHLCTGSALVAQDFHGALDLPEHFEELFMRKGPGDKRLPEADLKRYPSKAVLLAELTRQHERVVKGIQNANEEYFLKTDDTWAFGKRFPSNLDILHFMLITHEMNHIGQLACWRRFFDYPSAMRALALKDREG